MWGDTCFRALGLWLRPLVLRVFAKKRLEICLESFPDIHPVIGLVCIFVIELFEAAVSCA